MTPAETEGDARMTEYKAQIFRGHLLKVIVAKSKSARARMVRAWLEQAGVTEVYIQETEIYG